MIVTHQVDDNLILNVFKILSEKQNKKLSEFIVKSILTQISLIFDFKTQNIGHKKFEIFNQKVEILF